MKHTFKISGMHCQSCVTTLTDALTNLDGVDSALVTLDPPEARVEGSDFSSEGIKAAVSSAGDYSASEVSAGADSVASSPAEPTRSKLATYYPLILVVTFIVSACAILQLRTGDWSWMNYMNDFMGAFFFVFGFFKLLDLRGFVDAFQTYDLVAAKSRLYGYVYPFIEVALGAAFLMRFELLATNTATLVVMSVGAAGVLRSLLRKQTIKCACLGTVIDLPMSTVTLIEDVGMAVMAAAMIIWLV